MRNTRSIFVILICVALAQAAFGQKGAAKKPTATSGSIFEMTIEHNGQKTEIKSTQFQTADGMAVNADQGRVTLFYGASNNNNDKSFSFNGWVPIGQTGIFKLGDDNDRGFSVVTSVIPNVPMFIPEKCGTIEITNNPTKGGFVVGTFRSNCKVVTDAGTLEDYTISGSFKLARR